MFRSTDAGISFSAVRGVHDGALFHFNCTRKIPIHDSECGAWSVLELTQPAQDMPAGAYYFADKTIWRSEDSGRHWKPHNQARNEKDPPGALIHNWPYAGRGAVGDRSHRASDEAFYFQSEVYRQRDGSLLHGCRTPGPATCPSCLVNTKNCDHLDGSQLWKSQDNGIHWHCISVAAGGACNGTHGAPCDWQAGYVDQCANMSKTAPFLRLGSMYTHFLRLNQPGDTRLLMTWTKRSPTLDDDGFGSGTRGLLSHDGDTWDLNSDYIVLQAQDDNVGSEYGQSCRAGCGCAVGFGNTIQLPNGTLISVYMHDQSIASGGASNVISIVRWTLPPPQKHDDYPQPPLWARSRVPVVINDDWGQWLNQAIQDVLTSNESKASSVITLPPGRLSVKTPIKLWKQHTDGVLVDTRASNISKTARIGHVWDSIVGGVANDTVSSFTLRGQGRCDLALDSTSNRSGCSALSTVLVWDGPEDSVVLDMPAPYNVVLQDFSIDGQFRPSCVGIRYRAGYEFRANGGKSNSFLRLSLFRLDTAIEVGGPMLPDLVGSTFRQINIEHVRVGFLFFGANVAEMWVSECKFNNYTGAGIKLEGYPIREARYQSQRGQKSPNASVFRDANGNEIFWEAIPAYARTDRMLPCPPFCAGDGTRRLIGNGGPSVVIDKLVAASHYPASWLVDSNGPSVRLTNVRCEGVTGLVRNTGEHGPGNWPAWLDPDNRTVNPEPRADARFSDMLYDVSNSYEPHTKQVAVVFNKPGPLHITGGSLGANVVLGNNSAVFDIGVRFEHGAKFIQAEGTIGAQIFGLVPRDVTATQGWVHTDSASVRAPMPPTVPAVPAAAHEEELTELRLKVARLENMMESLLLASAARVKTDDGDAGGTRGIIPRPKKHRQVSIVAIDAGKRCVFGPGCTTVEDPTGFLPPSPAIKTDDAASGVNISIALADNKAIAMGQAAKVRTTWVYSGNAEGSALVAFPFVNGSQWGAQITLAANGLGSAGRSNGSRTLLLPIPHTGLASLVLIVLKQPLSGVTVGAELASLSDIVSSSNSLSFRVHHRQIIRLGNGGKTHFGSQWEPIVAADGVKPGGGGMGWSSHEAVPLVGKYSAFDYSVLKQHAIWLAESGIDCLLIDWSNNIGSSIASFHDIPAMSWKIINGTTFALQGYDRLRGEGIPCPKIALMMGVFEPPNALNGQLQWVRENYATSAFVTLEGQPLLLMLDGGGPPSTHELAMKRSKQLNTTGFSLRFTSAFMSGANQTGFPRSGWWSWMDDGTPTVAMHNGAAESVTISAAFFRLLGSKAGSELGWLRAPQFQTDRRGGATFLRSMVMAFQSQPKFVWIHQWNEFIGVVPKQLPRPGRDFFGDEFNASLSDDIEPTDLYECGAVRPGDSACGGWGFLFLNLQRAFVSMLSGAYTDNSAGGQMTPSLLTIALPTNRQPVLAESGCITVKWVQLGARASSYVLLLRDEISVLTRASVNSTAESCNESSSEHFTDGKGRTLFLQSCKHCLSLEDADSLAGQAATVTVESMTGSPGSGQLHQLLSTPFPLALSEMDHSRLASGGGSWWAPTIANVSIVLGPPFPTPIEWTPLFSRFNLSNASTSNHEVQLKSDDMMTGDASSAVAAAEPELRAVESAEDTVIRNDVGLWNDTRGNPLHAHGGGMYIEAGLFYWVGAYTLGPNLPYDSNTTHMDSYSMALYSSTNLGDWELRSSSIINKSAFTDCRFQSPVINASDPVELHHPKLIRSSATDKYVLDVAAYTGLVEMKSGVLLLAYDRQHGAETWLVGHKNESWSMRVRINNCTSKLRTDDETNVRKLKRRGIYWAVGDVTARGPASVSDFLLGTNKGHWANTSESVSNITTGILQCCSSVVINGTGHLLNLLTSELTPGAFQSYRDKDIDVFVDIGALQGGGGLNCSNVPASGAKNSSCVTPANICGAALARKDAFAEEVLALVAEYNVSGVSIDWEFQYGNNQTCFAALWKHVTSVIARSGQNFGFAPWVNNGGGWQGPDWYVPTEWDYWSYLPWANRLINMGSYTATGPAWKEGGLKPVACASLPHGDPATLNSTGRWCGLEGTIVDMLERGNATPAQIVPAVWMDRCFTNGSMTQTGWTDTILREFLDFATEKDIITIAVWTDGAMNGGGPRGDMMDDPGLATCTWFVPALQAWANPDASYPWVVSRRSKGVRFPSESGPSHTSIKTTDDVVSKRAISWWSETVDSRDVDGVLAFVKAHRSIITTVILEFGVLTCVRTHKFAQCTNDLDGCPSYSQRPRGRKDAARCIVSCAMAECTAAGMAWPENQPENQPENHSMRPYGCCHQAHVAKTDDWLPPRSALQVTTGGPAVTTGPTRAPTVDMWYADAMEKVFPMDAAPTCTAQPAVEMFAAAAEHVSFQLVVRTHSQLDRVSLRATTLSPSGSGAGAPILGLERAIDTPQVSVLRVAYVNVTEAVNSENRVGLFPDPLPPLQPSMSMSPGQNNPLWVTVSVPESCLRGRYTGIIELMEGPASIASVQLAVTVRSFALPSSANASLLADAGFSLGEAFMRPANVTRSATLVNAFYDQMATHRINRQVFSTSRTGFIYLPPCLFSLRIY
jgi:hypothetical protein